MTVSKRLFDVCFALVLLLLLGPLIALLALIVLLVDGRPVIFRSDRMKSPTESFTLLKFRTMTVDATDNTVSAGYKSAQITRTGRFLRRTRLDELPQLFNILRGDMSFVGPRPPLPRYVALRPDLYNMVLQNRPGVTGLATLIYHRHEEKILAGSLSAEETHHLYLHRCVPVKARLDLIWARHQTLCYDVILIFTTLSHFMRRLLPVRAVPARTRKTEN